MSYTTKLLDQAMPRRHQYIAAAVILWIAGGALAATLARPRPEPALQPRIAEKAVILVIATPSPAPAQPTWTPQPTSEPVVIVQTVEIPVERYVEVQAAPEPAQAVEQAPEPEWHPPMVADTSDICATWHAPMVYPPECEPATQLPMPQQAVR